MNEITSITTYEGNLKTVLRFYLELIISEGESFTPQQTLTLTSIADQCRYEGGFGVVLARLALKQVSTREEECQTESRGESGDQNQLFNTIKTMLSPNPASGDAVHVQLDRNIQDGTVTLTNINGQVIENWNFTGSDIDIRPSQVVSGIYMVVVREQNHILSRTKLVIIR